MDLTRQLLNIKNTIEPVEQLTEELEYESVTAVNQLLTEGRIGNYTPPFKANGLWVDDRYGTSVLEVTRHDTAKQVAAALNAFVKTEESTINQRGVTEMDNRTAAGDRREQRANSPEVIAQREKELQANLKNVSPNLRKKLRLPEPKEGMAEGSSSKLSSPFEGGRRTTSITAKHKPLVWENMLGTVMAKDPASKAEPKYFDYKWAEARAYAKVDQCDDLRICKSPGLYQGWPEKGKMALWGIPRQGVVEGSEDFKARLEKRRATLTPDQIAASEKIFKKKANARGISNAEYDEFKKQQAGKKKEQGVEEGSEPQVGDEVYYGNRLVGTFKGYSKLGKIITEPNVKEMGDEYLSKDAYWDPKDITIKPKQGVAEGSEDPSYKKGWKLCDKDPSADPQHLFRKHGEGLDRNQFIKGFNDNAKLRGMSIYGDVSGDVDHSTLRYKEFKRDQGVAEGSEELNSFYSRTNMKEQFLIKELLQLKENSDERLTADHLYVGTPVEITGNVEFKGSTGEISSFGEGKKFVVVRLYHDGQKHSFHSSDVRELDVDEDDYDIDDEEDSGDFYVVFHDEDEQSTWIGRLTQEGGKWRERSYKGKPDYRWGTSYMGYLSQDDVMSWIHKDYSRGMQIDGPFDSAEDAEQFAKHNYGQIEEMVESAKAVVSKSGDFSLTCDGDKFSLHHKSKKIATLDHADWLDLVDAVKNRTTGSFGGYRINQKADSYTLNDSTGKEIAYMSATDMDKLAADSKEYLSLTEAQVYTNFDDWKKAVLNSYPAQAKKIKFKGRMEGKKTTISAEIPGEDRSYGVWDGDDNEGVVLSESLKHAENCDYRFGGACDCGLEQGDDYED